MMRIRKVFKPLSLLLIACAMLINNTTMVGAQPTDAPPAEFVQETQTISSKTVRDVIDVRAEWRYKNGILDDTPAAKNYDDREWELVNLPHGWNAKDGADGGDNYLQTVGWYRKAFTFDASVNDKQVFFEVGAATIYAEVFVNGEKVGFHKGGYTRLRFDITDYLENGPNVIAIKVDNIRRNHQDIAPLSGDFTVFGGISRNVDLIITDQVHVDNLDYASSGLYLTTRNVSAKSADLNIKSTIVNDSAEEKQVTVKATLRHPDTFEVDAGITPLFDTKTMVGGGDVESVEQSFVIEKNSQAEFKHDLIVSNPRLWHGMSDPYRYQVALEVFVNGVLVDEVVEYVGFRSFSVDSETGFYLNGESYPLRGVAHHQDRRDKGYATSYEDKNEDFSIMYDLGANTVRLAHYPHDPYYVDLCDKYGIVVYAEIPFVNGSGWHADFNDVTNEQLIEMIRQYYNHPSIMFWGLQNEVWPQDDRRHAKLLTRLHATAKAEDDTRLTVQAIAQPRPLEWDSDILAYNHYAGWYSSRKLGEQIDIAKNDPRSKGRPMGISEYGAGGSIYHHENDVPWMGVTHDGPWHPEEYQNMLHEDAMHGIYERDYIWGTYIWNLFDFGSDHKKEGDTLGINDKGLVTYDRKTMKDSYYLYRQKWNPEPLVYITSRRFDEREILTTPVTVYANTESVELFVNGESQGIKHAKDHKNGIFKWEKDEMITLKTPEDDRVVNTIEAIGLDADNKKIRDTVEWFSVKSGSTKLLSDKFLINHEDHTIALTEPLLIEDIFEFFKVENDGTLKVFAADKQTELTHGDVERKMVIQAIAADGKTATFYEFVIPHIAVNKKVTASSEEVSKNNYAKNAVDFDRSTRWAAASGGPAFLEIDLEEVYNLSGIQIEWFNSASKRAYFYKVKVSEDGEHYETVVDRSNNQEQDIVKDTFDAKGRFVRIEVSGATSGPSAFASLYEVEVYGWSMNVKEDSGYVVDEENKVIIIPEADTTEYLPKTFFEIVSFNGNVEASIDGPSYFISGNGMDTLIIEVDGQKIEYLLYFSNQDIHAIKSIAINEQDLRLKSGETYPLTVQYLPETASSFELKWESDNPAVATVDENGTVTAHKPGVAQIRVAVEDELNIEDSIEVAVYHDGEVAHKKPTYSSGDENSTNSVANINDGDLNSRWAAEKIDNAGKYPEWVAIDLGETMDVSAIESYFFKYNENNRAYRYKLYVGTPDSDPNEDLEAFRNGFNEDMLFFDNSENKDRIGHHLDLGNKQGRYVLMEVTGCDLFDNGPAYFIASIHEIKVYGTATEVEEKTFNVSGSIDHEHIVGDITPLTIVLLDHQQQEVATTTSDASGNFAFAESFLAGTYTLKIAALENRYHEVVQSLEILDDDLHVEILLESAFEAADKTKLAELIAESEDLNEAELTEQSYQHLLDVLKQAQAVMKDEVVTQEVVDNVVALLEQALADLELDLSAEIAALEATIAKAKKIIVSDYTEASVLPFEAALALAKKTLNQTSVTLEELKAANTKLMNAIGQLELKMVDDQALSDLIDEIKTIDLSEYSEASVKELNHALEQAETLLLSEDRTQEDVDGALKKLQDAYDGLESIAVVDKTALQKLVDRYLSEDLSEYTQESVAQLKALLEEATAVIKDKGVTQSHVDELLKALEVAYENLELDLSDVIAQLQALLEKARLIDQSLYTEASVLVLQSAMDEASLILEKVQALVSVTVSKEDIVAATKALEAAMEQLELSPGVTELEPEPEPVSPDTDENQAQTPSDSTPETSVIAQPGFYWLLLVAGLALVLRKRKSTL